MRYSAYLLDFCCFLPCVFAEFGVFGGFRRLSSADFVGFLQKTQSILLFYTKFPCEGIDSGEFFVYFMGMINTATPTAGESGMSSPSVTTQTSASTPTHTPSGDDDLFGQALAERQTAKEAQFASEHPDFKGSQHKSDQSAGHTDPDTPNSVPTPKTNGTGSQETGVEDNGNPQNFENGGSGQNQNPDDAQNGVSNRSQNSLNAERRIRNKHKREAMQQRINELQQELAYYRKYAEEHPDQQAQVEPLSQQVIGQLRNMQAVVQSEAAQDYYDRAVSTFGPEIAEKFIESSKRYADFVNRREPVVRQFIGRPYGQILLYEWMERMDKNEKLRNEWFTLTDYEKQKALSILYGNITKALSQRKAGGNGNGAGQGNGGNGQNGGSNSQNPQNPNPQNQQPQPVAVPNSGRDQGTPTPADDFLANYEEAKKRRRRESSL